MWGIYTENEYGRLEWRDRVRTAYIMWRNLPIVEICHEYYEMTGEAGWVFKPLWMNLEMCKISGEYVPIEPIDFNDKKTEYAMKFIPKFVLERTPQYEGRRLYKLLEELGLTYKDLYEILCRTHGVCSKDNYYVSRTPDKVVDVRNSKIPYDIPNFNTNDYGWLKEKVAPDGTPENRTNHWTLDEENTVDEIKRMQEEQEKRFSLYEYYGIPYGYLCGGGIDEGTYFSNPKNVDRNAARLLIMQDKPIPKDLEERLFKYKRISEQYEYYGLDAYCGWDDNIEEEITPLEELLDVGEGMKLIRANQELPKDLAERLLGYKRKHFVEEHAYMILQRMAYGYSCLDNEVVILCFNLNDLEERIVFRISETNELVYLEDTMLSIGNKEKAMSIAKRNKKYLLEGVQKWLANENRIDFDVYKRKDMK